MWSSGNVLSNGHLITQTRGFLVRSNWRKKSQIKTGLNIQQVSSLLTIIFSYKTGESGTFMESWSSTWQKKKEQAWLCSDPVFSAHSPWKFWSKLLGKKLENEVVALLRSKTRNWFPGQKTDFLAILVNYVSRLWAQDQLLGQSSRKRTHQRVRQNVPEKIHNCT